VRAWLALFALALCTCAGTPQPVALDPEAHGRLTVDGFRDASELVSTRLEAAAAWAVFPDVEDTRKACSHEGLLFQPGAPPRPTVLRCSVRPTAPAGAAYHLLVVLDDPAALTRLEEEGLELDLVPHLSPHDGFDPPPASEKIWVVTSERTGLLFDAWAPRQRLELIERD